MRRKHRRLRIVDKDKFLMRIGDLIAVMFLAYLGISLVMWNVHSCENYSKWNVFCYLSPTEADASQELSIYEETKGKQNVQLVSVWTEGVDYTYDEYIELAQIIQAEAGSSYLSDTLRYYVGSVVLNRVKDDRFPNTIHEVLHQAGQYYPVMSGIWQTEPNEVCLEIAADLLETGSELPSNVVWQSNFSQGNGVYTKLEGMYFCY